MSLKASNDDGSIDVETTFAGEYDAFGVYGKTTSDPSTLVWLDGFESQKFGLHHPEKYGVEETLRWLVNAVLGVPFEDVPQHARDAGVRLAVKRSPVQEPEFVDAREVFA